MFFAIFKVFSNLKTWGRTWQCVPMTDFYRKVNKFFQKFAKCDPCLITESLSSYQPTTVLFQCRVVRKSHLLKQSGCKIPLPGDETSISWVTFLNTSGPGRGHRYKGAGEQGGTGIGLVSRNPMELKEPKLKKALATSAIAR